jgi:2-iminobutanoate/2-iminopropanoate deaminase
MAVDTRSRNLILFLTIAFLAGFALHAIIMSVYQHPANRIIITNQAPKPIGPYSQGVHTGDFVFVSGQIGIDPATGNLSANVDEQTIQVMENIRAILQEEGLDFSDVVQARIYLTDLKDFETVNGIYQRYFESSFPTRATVQVSGLPKGAKVEIEVVAKVRSRIPYI